MSIKLRLYYCFCSIFLIPILFFIGSLVAIFGLFLPIIILLAPEIVFKEENDK